MFINIVYAPFADVTSSSRETGKLIVQPKVFWGGGKN